MRSKPRSEPSRSTRSDSPFPSTTYSEARSVDAASGKARRSCVPGLSLPARRVWSRFSRLYIAKHGARPRLTPRSREALELFLTFAAGDVVEVNRRVAREMNRRVIPGFDLLDVWSADIAAECAA